MVSVGAICIVAAVGVCLGWGLERLAKRLHRDGLVSVNEVDLECILARKRHLEKQVDELQQKGTELVLENRELRRFPWLRDMVREFQRLFGVEMPSKPMTPPDGAVKLRARLLVEETFEFLEAVLVDKEVVKAMEKTTLDIVDTSAVHVDMIEANDALGDVKYVAEGAFLVFGVDSRPVMGEIQRSNIEKLGGEKRADGKILKPANWKPPNIRQVLLDQGWVPPEVEVATTEEAAA